MDDETNRNSAKLDIEAARQQSAAVEKDSQKEKQLQEPKESYKKLSDDELDQVNGAAKEPKADSDEPAMVRENGNCKDGEDEKMLNGGGGDGTAAATNGGEKEKLTQKELEVTFTSEQNGDVRLNLEVEKQQTFSGMSKDELMKFANDPFWVRLRWFLFIVFWGLWVGMLAGAVYIIMDAPKCAAPVPLSWWQKGPLVTVDEQSYRGQVEDVKRYGASGVVYKLPEDETYFVDGAGVEGRIKELVKTFGATDIKVILDVTANFVTKEDALFKEATASSDAPQRSAFVWRQAGDKTNWLEVGTTDRTSAWKSVDSGLILGQFGPDRYDLQLSDPIAKEKLKGALRRLVDLGVDGFRLANAKHFIVDGSGKDDEIASPASDKSLTHDHYDFWTHSHTTYQPGLGALLHELALEVRNYTRGDGFLSVSEDIVRPEAFADGSQLGVDLPEYGNVEAILKAPITTESAKIIRDDIERTLNETDLYSSVSGGKLWNQWPYDKSSLVNIPASEYNVFMFLLPGVPVVPLDVLNYGNGSRAVLESLNKFRQSPSFEHGSFAIYTDVNATAIGYTRQKSGNPGYFVALNPTDAAIRADFGNVAGIAEELTVVLLSENYREADIALKAKVQANAVPLSARAALIATYVPK